MKRDKIIVSRTDKIGDLVLSIPSFFMIREMYPNAEITVLVRNYNYEIVKNLPYIDRVIKIDDYRKDQLLEKIKYFKADVFIALYNDDFVMKLAKNSNAPTKIGPLSKFKSFFVYRNGIRQKRSKSIKNEAEYNLDLVRLLDPPLFDSCYKVDTKIYYEKKHKDGVEAFMKEKKVEGKPLIINPFMGGSAKNITDDQYTKLIQKILNKVENLNIVITCHINEEERGENLIKGLKNSEKVFLYANGGDLLNLAAMIDKGDLYFGGSTGPTHIAGALGKKVVGLYPNKATQSPLRWGVFGSDKVTYIVPDRYNKEEDYKHKYFDSYSEIVEDEIVEKISKNLN